MQSWTLSSQMVLVPNEQYWDRKHVYLDRVTIATTTATDDDVRARYTSSALDVAKIGNPDPFLRDATLAPAIVRLHDYSVKFLTLLQSRNRALRDLRVRQAIALGISRADVARASSALDPATSLVPRALPRFDQSVGFKENLAKARALLAEAGYPGGKGFPKLIVMTSYDDAFVRVVVRTLRRNLGIKAVQDVEDSAVESAKREEVQPANVVGFFSTGYTALLTWRNWVSDSYPPSQAELLSLSPDDYTHYQVLQASGTQKALAKATAFLAARASPASRRFASAAARADSTANAARAIALYKQAAALRQGTYEFIPYAYSSLAYVVRPGIKGVHLWTGYFTISFKGVSIG
jgi:ABC-type transport system substrate-binding protein